MAYKSLKQEARPSNRNMENENNDDVSAENNFMTNTLMTESYSEILNSPTTDTYDASGAQANTTIVITKRKPHSSSHHQSSQSSFPHGSVRVDESKMTHFVADNLELKIKSASSNDSPARQASARNHMLPIEIATEQMQKQFFSAFPQIDANALNDIEIEAQYLAANLDSITENLCNLLHSISAITADNVDTYKNAVNKLTDCMDANIKTMYTVMAKTEELSNRMKSTEALAVRIRDIKRVVDVLDSMV